jgi:hypothetical protein
LSVITDSGAKRKFDIFEEGLATVDVWIIVPRYSAHSFVHED